MNASKPQKRWKHILGLILVLTTLGLGFFFWHIGRLYQQRQRNYALIAAIKAQNPTHVQELLADGADANAVDTGEIPSFGQMLLHLLDGHSRKTGTAFHPSALILASRYLDGYERPNEEIILALLNHRANPNVEEDANQDGIKRNPVGYAILHDQMRVLRRLLECGANPNTKAVWVIKNGSVFHPNTPLMTAVIHSLLSRIAYPAVSHKDDTTRLLEVTRLLLEHGADVDAPNLLDSTPLMMAVLLDDPEEVLLLLQNGANPGTKDQKGRTALVYASDRLKQGKAPNNRKIISLLKQFGAKE